VTSQPDMRLPLGKTCGECSHHPRCVVLFGCPESNVNCDWSPSRFVQRAAPATREETDAYRRDLEAFRVQRDAARDRGDREQKRADTAEADRALDAAEHRRAMDHVHARLEAVTAERDAAKARVAVLEAECLAGRVYVMANARVGLDGHDISGLGVRACERYIAARAATGEIGGST
jgi:hypothetical protein